MENLFSPPKTVTLQLVGLDGNAFALMGAFSKQARREQWPKEDVDKVLDACKAGDYDHLLATLMEHCDAPEDEDDEDEEDEDDY